MGILVSKMGYARVNIELLNNAKITPTGWNIPQDIINGKAVTFRFEYTWKNDNTTCEISNIKWYPSQYHQDSTTPSNGAWWPIINEAGNGITSGTKVSFESNGVFDQNGKIKLTFGSTVKAITDKKLNGCYNNNTLNNGTGTISVTNIQAPQLFGSFEYSYTVRYVDGNWVQVTDTTPTSDYSDIEYFIKIDNIRIPKISKYQNNVVFTEAGVNELIDNIKKYPIIDIETVADTQWATVSDGQPSIKIIHGNPNFDGSNHNYKYVKVGSNIKFINPSNGSEITSEASGAQKTGTFRVKINNKTYEVPIKGLAGGSGAINFSGSLVPTVDSQPSSGGGYNLGSSDYQWNVLYARAAVFGNADQEDDGKSDAASNVRPYTDNTGSLGTSAVRWKNGFFVNLGSSEKPITNAYITNLGSADNPVTNAYIATGRFDTIKIKMGDNYPDLSTYINNQVTYDDNHQLAVTNTKDGIKQGSSSTATNGFSSSYTGTYYGDTTASIYTKGGIYAEKNIIAKRVFNAVFNDYAECRTTINLTPGHVVIDQDDGSLACSSKRLQPGAQVISDTYGHLMGGTDKAKTPIAVAGRVLVYTYQPRENYHAGMAVCSAPDGTVDIMSRAEICEYPDCIIGIVSEIPQYETWGSDNIKVDGRIWIKVK